MNTDYQIEEESYDVSLKFRSRSDHIVISQPKAPVISYVKSRNQVPRFFLDEGTYDNKTDLLEKKKSSNSSKDLKSCSKKVYRTINTVKAIKAKDLWEKIMLPHKKNSVFNHKPVSAKRTSILSKLLSKV